MPFTTKIDVKHFETKTSIGTQNPIENISRNTLEVVNFYFTQCR